MKELNRYMIITEEENTIVYTPDETDNAPVELLFPNLISAWENQVEDDGQKIIKVVTQQSLLIEVMHDATCPECGAVTTILKEGDRMLCTECEKWSPADGTKPWHDVSESVLTILDLVVNKLLVNEEKTKEQIMHIMEHAVQEKMREKSAV